MRKAVKGNNVKVHYRGTFDDGREFDNSRLRGAPISFLLGEGRVIKGFEKAVEGMETSEKKTITLPPEQAYGPINPEAVIEVPKGRFPDEFVFVKDGFVRSFGKNGRPVFGKITDIKDESVVLDVNHPLAGKQLTFELELVQVETPDDAAADEDDSAATATGEWTKSMKKAELLAAAQAKGLGATSKMTKSQIIEALIAGSAE
jgi:FKBP-type peptidyl-prolyl cis-trans isomerase 2